MQDINEECVVLQEVISLQTAAITDPKVSKKFAVVGCEDRIGITCTPNNKYVLVVLYMFGQCALLFLFPTPTHIHHIPNGFKAGKLF